MVWGKWSALLLLPGGTLLTPAHAQFTVTATQETSAGRDRAPYAGTCTRTTCRITMPVLVDTDSCVLNLSVEAPRADRVGTILFSSGPCYSRTTLTI